MAMVVQHNLTAMNSSRMLGITTGAQAKTSEKLASGYRINRAGDDAAGLKISEKMRSQIRGLQKASKNAQDGVSLIQTAEGALNEAHSILQRMNELVVQGANDTNQGIDRDAINEELAALTEEIDRIAETTEFNKQKLLDGSFSDKNLQVGANANQNIEIGIREMNATALGLRNIVVTPEGDPVVGDGGPQSGLKATGVSYGNLSAYAVASSTMTMKSIQEAAISHFNAKITSAAKASQYVLQISGTEQWYEDSFGKKYSTATAAMNADVSTTKAAMEKALKNEFATYLKTSAVSATTSTVAGGVTLPGTAEETISAPKVDNYDMANQMITKIQAAIDDVSSQRSALGALQNRLEHTIANLDNVAENTQAAESRIRDTDMAAEMVEYSKNNILAQAGQSMLAQANQSTQGVLSLLQ